MHVFEQYFENIHANTCKYTQYEHQNSNTNFLKPQVKVYVLGIYLLVFASIFVSICKYLVSICKYCIYLLVSMRLAILCALNTCKYLQYLQILTGILADTYTKYLQIRASCIACICMYLHVFGSICMYLLLQGQETFLSSVFCMYLHVYACNWIVNDKITINTTAKLPKIAQQ